MTKSYYGRMAQGQMQAINTRITSGLNEYTPSHRIDDNYLSSALDFIPSKNESIYFNSTPTYSLFRGDADCRGLGMVYCAIADRFEETATVFKDHLLLVSSLPTSGDVIDTFTDLNIANPNTATVTKTTFSISAHSFRRYRKMSMCLFQTDAKRYVCFVNGNTSKLLYYDYTAVNVIPLPFIPIKVVSHYSRLFCLDNGNKVWWCRAGDLTSWYGAETDDDYLKATGNMQATVYTLLHTTLDVPRPWTATITRDGLQDTYGDMTVIGTDSQDNAQTEARALDVGLNIGYKSFKTISSMRTANWVTSGNADDIKLGVGAVGNGYVQQDAGYWSMEQERTLIDMAVIGNSLFIFSDVNVYELSGYSPDTFNLAKRIVDIGCDSSQTIIDSYYLNMPLMTTSNNTIYFVFAGDIYEFNGNDYPRIISRPLEANGASINGMFGGIEPDTLVTYSLVADKDYLYYYQTAFDDSVTDDVEGNQYIQLYIYKFDLRSRSWWKISGFSSMNTHENDFVSAYYVTEPDRSGLYSIFSFQQYDNGISANEQWILNTHIGFNPVEKPYFITKSYNTNPSEKSTLTQIIMQLESRTWPSAFTFRISYSLTNDKDDFVPLYEDFEHIFDGSIENITVNVGNSAIAKASNYRLKFEVDDFTDGVYAFIYNIERRFRVMGRTR